MSASSARSGLEGFHPFVQEWFSSKHGEPTRVQAEAWARIAAGEHVLAVAPTGSGKTLAAFLHAISLLVSGGLPPTGLSVLYVSPLKALNEDVRRNLEAPLQGIAEVFALHGLPPPALRVETRSGDTPQAQRRRFLSKPPNILCTTPESLAILLDSPRVRPILSGVRLLVLDEIHAVAGSKRGSLLASSVGRLALLAGEFQRVALSATVRPREEAAAFVGGRRLERPEGGPAAHPERPVAIVAPAIDKRVEFSVEWPSPRDFARAAGEGGQGGGAGADENRYDAVIPAIAARLSPERSVLVFTDSRRRAERMAFLLNEREGEGTAYAHHGSLAKEARLVVEERFKAGELRCVVATASLELGIDIGGVDEVILAGAPPEINAVLQRAGRSGHGVGLTSRAVVYPFHGMDLLVAAAVVGGAIAGEIEALKLPRAPLDILAQVLLSMACERDWQVDELYETIRAFPPFERLDRRLFDGTVEMLAGRYALPKAAAAGRGAARLRELEPRVAFDRLSGTIRAREGVRALLYSSGGAIPDRGHYSMRVAGSKTRIGELDEEFVYERKVGDAFTLGAQSWRIVDIGAEAVEVLPLGQGSDFIPFWKAEARYRSPEASDRLLGLVDRLGDALRGMDGTGGPPGRAAAEGATARKDIAGRDAAEAILVRESRFSPEAARVAVSFLAAQAAASDGRLPGRRSVSVELYADPARRGDAHCVVIHTLRGGAVNEPLGLVLAAAFEEAGGLRPEVMSDDNFVLVILPAAEGAGGQSGTGPEAVAERIMGILGGLGSPARVEALLKSQLEGSGLFGAQFRESAGRALLLPRGSPGKRNPLWVTRLRAKRLFDAVSAFPDFPITAETWRSCLVDLFDMDGLCDLLDGLASFRISAGLFRSRSPSPFAREAIWRETGEYMYQGDAMKGRAASTLSDDVIKAAVASSRLRPRLAGDLIEAFRAKARRLVPGWGPQDLAELAEWVKELVILPEAELPAVFASGEAGLAAAFASDPTASGRLSRVLLPGASEAVHVHEERRAELVAEPASFVAEWLRREGPVAPSRIRELFGIPQDELDSLLEELEDAGLVVIDEFRKGDPKTEVLDAENLEVLLRLSRKAARPRVEARPASSLFRLVARLQGLGPSGAVPDGTEAEGADRGDRLAAVLSALSGLALPVRLWETEILPARIPRYAPQDLDALLAEGDFLWFGAGRESVAFCRPEALELHGAGSGSSSLLGSGGELLDFWAIKERSGLGSKEAAKALWEEAWAGLAAGQGFEVLRRGMRNRFGKELPDLEGGSATDGAVPGSPRLGHPKRLPRALRERWRDGAPVSGRWFSLELPEAGQDALEEEELQAARVRAVAARYGLLCRSILEREAPALRWSALFPAMRRMELRGELLYGRFFEGLDGPQFLVPEAFEALGRLDDGYGPGAGFLWLNALDPAAQAAGLGGKGLPPPDRLPGNRLCVGPGGIVAILARGGRDLGLLPGAEEGLAAGVAASLAALRGRLGGRLSLERINGEVAAYSPLSGSLTDAGFEKDRTRLVLW